MYDHYITIPRPISTLRKGNQFFRFGVYFKVVEIIRRRGNSSLIRCERTDGTGRTFFKDPSHYIDLIKRAAKPRVYSRQVRQLYKRPVHLGYDVHYCSVFGCGQKLTPTERLYGSRCVDHQFVTKPDPTLYATL